MSSGETIAAWPSRIRDESEVPEIFADAFRAVELHEGGFPLVLYSPAFRFDRYLEPATLLVRAGDRLTCLTWRRGRATTQSLKLGDVYRVERGTELLHSWIAFHAHGPSGHSSVRADFNTMGLGLYLPLLRELRTELYPVPGSGANASTTFDHLATVNFKFMNLARESLEPGVEARAFVLQNVVRVRLLRLFDKVVIPASMAIATQQELILIREGDAQSHEYYGATWTYVRLDRLERISVFPLERGQALVMEAVLPGKERVRAEFELAKDAELRALVACVQGSHPSIRD